MSRSSVAAPITGVLGPYLFRRKKNGEVIVVLRARSDRRSPEQLEQRRRFSIIISYASKMYLAILRPYATYWHRDYSPFALMVKSTIVDWYEGYGFPLMLIYGRDVPTEYYTTAWMDGVSPVLRFSLNTGYADRVLPSDVIRSFCMVGPTGSLIIDLNEHHVGGADYSLNYTFLPGLTLVWYYSFAIRIDRFGICRCIAQWHEMVAVYT